MASAGLAVVGCSETPVFPLSGADDPSRPPGVSFAVSPAALSFPTTRLDCAGSDAEVTVRNFTSQVLTIGRGTLRDPAGAFAVDWPSPLPGGALDIPPRGTVVIPVRFRPPDLGRFDAEIEIEVQVAGDGVRTVRLSGQAVETLSVSDTFQQITSLDVDVVFVVDNSASMSLEQEGLRNNFRSFAQAADDGFTDYRVAVTTTDVEGQGGRFVPVSDGVDVDGDGVPDDLDFDGDVDEVDLILEREQTPERRVDRDSEPTPEIRFRRLAEVGLTGRETEQGLEAARLALSPSRTLAANAFFFREDALLSLVFVSDERDQSPLGVDDYVAAYRTLAPSGRVRASAVVGLPPDGCSGEAGAATPAPRYVEVARQLGGGVASICTTDWGSTLQEISGLAFGLQRRFQLSGFAVEQPRVFIEGTERPAVFDTGRVNWTWDPEARTVEFVVEQTPPLGSEIRIDYELACSP